MRKLIVSMNVTLDGFLSGLHCELDWHFQSWSSDMATALATQLANADTILLGRITYNAMASYWPSKALDLSCPREDLAFVEMMNRYTKIVVSKNPVLPQWGNSRVLNGNLAEEICQLKVREGKNIIIYGSGKLVSALMKLALVDEYQLWIHPVAIGDGKPLFPSMQQKRNMQITKTEIFSSGVVLLSYKFSDPLGQPARLP